MKGTKRHVRVTSIISLGALVAVLGLILGWWRCGWGRGEGEGAGTGKTESAAPDATSATAEATASDVPAVPCILRLDTSGLTADGKAVDVAGAVAACTGRDAQIHVVGDVPFGRFDEVKRAFEAAKIHLDIED
jgi:hypothetical protein